MKKLITVAALVAAGTAFSNAATVITINDLSTSINGGISYDATTGTLSGSSLFNAYSIDNVNRSTASTTINLDLTALGTDSEGSSYSGTSSANIVRYQVGTSTTGAIGLAAIEHGLQFTWEDSAYGSDTYISWETLRGSSYTQNEKTYVTLTLIATARPGGNDTAVGGSQVYNSDGGNFTFTKTDGTTGTGYGYSGLKSGKSYDTIYVNTDYVSAVSVFAGAATATEIATASQLVVVPEPSSFGADGGNRSSGAGRGASPPQVSVPAKKTLKRPQRFFHTYCNDNGVPAV